MINDIGEIVKNIYDGIIPKKDLESKEFKTAINCFFGLKIDLTFMNFYMKTGKKFINYVHNFKKN